MLATILAGAAAICMQSQPRLSTAWSQTALEGRGWTEYPRPQLKRKVWQNLNGKWDLALTSQEGLGGIAPILKVNVPYPVESALSGVGSTVDPKNVMVYSRAFTVPREWNGQKWLLHFGGVDWHAKVYVNDKLVGEHKGGYDPFSCDVTSAAVVGENKLRVDVTDPTDAESQPRGKQVLKPNGIWYTAVSGIWQTVWMEPVAETHIERVWCETKADGSVTVNTMTQGDLKGVRLLLTAKNGRSALKAEGTPGKPVTFKIPRPKLWSPDSPNLYDLDLKLVRNGKTLDVASAYFGIREIRIKDDKFGKRVYLNGKPVFMFGPLDQGWWPDGLYTPPTEAAMRYDLEQTKKMGFNTVRKHVKVEPALWYRACDELGLIVWQDMPSTTSYNPGWDTDYTKWNPKPDSTKRPAVSARQYDAELKAMIDNLRCFPCIGVWVPFNEGWGQFDTARVATWVKGYDKSRLVNSASGGNFVETGDIFDIHAYPGPAAPSRKAKQAIVLGEFGGLGFPIKDHVWQADGNWGYVSYANAEELAGQYSTLIDRLVWLKSTGLSAAIYTQTTDVEIEVNGLMTYDRKITKIPVDRLAKINKAVYGEPITVKTVLATADEKPSQWSWIDGEPEPSWYGTKYNDKNWSVGLGGFGTKGTPGAVVGTTWDSSQIWIRKKFDVAAVPKKLWLKVHHDEDCEVYLNGKILWRGKGYTTGYIYVSVNSDRLIKGRNVLAVHCRQTNGGQYIDVGFSQSL